MPKGKIFISYRRDSGAAAARLLREALCSRRFPVFMDVEDLRAGQYRDILSSQVEACSDFILVLTPGSLEKCLQEGDWVAREVAEALRLKKEHCPRQFRGSQLAGGPAPGHGGVAGLSRSAGSPTSTSVPASIGLSSA